MAANDPASGGTRGDSGNSHDRSRLVRRYLSALDARKPGRSNARTAETVAHRMHQVDTLLVSADPVQRLHLTQERIDLHAEHLRLNTANGSFGDLEKAFTRVARSYGERHDITFSAWRQVGVEADVLARAGIASQAKSNNRPQQPPVKSAPPTSAAPTAEAPTAEAPPAEAPPAEAPTVQPTPAKKAPVSAAAKSNGDRPAKKQPSKKQLAAKMPAEDKPQQQSLPAEAHLLG